MDVSKIENRFLDLLRPADREIIPDAMAIYLQQMRDLIRDGYEKLAADRGASLIDTFCRFRPEVSADRVLRDGECWTFEMRVEFKLREEQILCEEDVQEFLERHQGRG